MKNSIIRTLQFGITLIVLTVAGVAVMAILGVMSQEAALRIAYNVSAIIAVCMVAGIVLTALFGTRNNDGD